tara:strand:- start:3293 stop:3574 length:282 start_codon:yes stop_codon:yes gene_type:complete
MQKIPSNEEISKQLPPEMRELFKDDAMVVTIARAFPFYQKLIEALLRNMVKESNLNTIAPTQLAGHTILRGCSLFAEKGQARLKELQNQPTSK